MTRKELIEEAANAMSQGYVQDGRISSFFTSAEAAFAVFEKAQCKRCGQLAEGYAFIGDDRYCHPDDGVDCYTRASHELTSLANQAFIEKAQAPTDDERTELLAEADELVSLWDHKGSWTSDSPVGLVMRLARFIRRPAQTEPADDEREALGQASVDSERLRQIAEWLSMEHGHEETAKRVNIIADRHDALARRTAQGEPSDAAPEGAEVTFFTQLDGDYAEESATLAQAEYVRREASGLIPPAERKITKRVTYWVDMPAAYAAGQED